MKDSGIIHQKNEYNILKEKLFTTENDLKIKDNDIQILKNDIILLNNN